MANDKENSSRESFKIGDLALAVYPHGSTWTVEGPDGLPIVQGMATRDHAYMAADTWARRELAKK